jgi:hypothetical protein
VAIAEEDAHGDDRLLMGELVIAILADVTPRFLLKTTFAERHSGQRMLFVMVQAR